MKLEDVVNGAVGAFPLNCAGYGNPGASGLGYIATLKLSLGCVDKGVYDEGLSGIVSYDRCEANDAYIGQINMLTASSFCGENGAVWGYHLARADDLHVRQWGTIQAPWGEVPVWDVAPLLDATQRLFGIEGQRRFNPLPGAMVTCANKNRTADGPTTVWSSIALAIASDRDTQANLFIEDASDTAQNKEQPVDPMVVAKSIVACGIDQSVTYKEIFVGVKTLDVPEGYVGCALTCAPYVTIPPAAIPEDPERKKEAAYLLKLTISKWETSLSLPPLPAPPEPRCRPAHARIR